MKFIFDKTNKEKINNIRKNGYELVKSKRLIKNSSDKINLFIEKKISNNYFNDLDKINIILHNLNIDNFDFNSVNKIYDKINSITYNIDSIKKYIDTRIIITQNNMKLKY